MINLIYMISILNYVFTIVLYVNEQNKVSFTYVLKKFKLI
jgi:hypothetical protein